MNDITTTNDLDTLAQYLFGDPLTTTDWWKEPAELLSNKPFSSNLDFPPSKPSSSSLNTKPVLPFSPPLSPLVKTTKQHQYRAIAPAQPHSFLAPPPIVRGCKRNVTQEPHEIALKRQRNTDAARRSRQRRMLKLESLTERVTVLDAENHDLSTKVAVLTSEKSGLVARQADLLDRISKLESQLAQAHHALTRHAA